MAAHPQESRNWPRPMDFGELLDRSFDVLWQGRKPLLLLGLVAAVPSTLMTGVSNQMNVSLMNPAGLPPVDPGILLAGAVVVLLGLALFLFVYPWLQGALVWTASRVFLGEPVRVGDALRAAGKRYPALLGTLLLKGLLFVVAVPVLVIGGLVIFFWLTVPAGLIALAVYLVFPIPAIMLEQEHGGIPAFRRSWDLIGGKFWRLLGLGIVFSLLGWTISFFVSFLVALPFRFTLATGNGSSLLAWLSAIFQGLAQMVVLPLGAVGVTLAYYDTRMRKEGYDLERMLDANQQAEVFR